MATRRTIVQPGDQVITIAGDDDAIQMSGLTNLNINLESNILIIRGLGWFVRAEHAQTTPFPPFF